MNCKVLNEIDLKEDVSLARRGLFRPVTSIRFKLDHTIEALKMLKEHKYIWYGRSK